MKKISWKKKDENIFGENNVGENLLGEKKNDEKICGEKYLGESPNWRKYVCRTASWLKFERWKTKVVKIHMGENLKCRTAKTAKKSWRKAI